jgi:hypothetical protein
LPIAIHKCVLPMDISPAIDFLSPWSRPWIYFAIESKIMRKLPVGMDGDFA